MRNISLMIASAFAIALGFSLQAAQPMTLPETILQTKVNVGALRGEVERDLGKEIIADLMSDLDKAVDASEERRFFASTNIAWTAFSIEYSPAMVMRGQKQPEFSVIVEFNEDVDCFSEILAAGGHRHRRRLINVGELSYDDLYLELLENRLLIISSSSEILAKWKSVYQTSEALTHEPILPEGVIVRMQTAPISSMLETFGFKNYLLAYFENLGDPDLGECLASIRTISLRLESAPKDLLLSLDVESENPETREIFGTLFSSFALSLRLGVNGYMAMSEQLPNNLFDRQVHGFLMEHRALLRKALRAYHLPSVERLQLRIDRERIIGQLKYELKQAKSDREANASAMRGRRLFIAMSQATIEREGVGCPSVWPKTEATRSDDENDITGHVFATSSDYFEELFDLVNYGKGDWRPYIGGVDYETLFDQSEARWIVAAGEVDELDGDVPVLVSANVDRKALNEGRIIFEGEWAVFILKSGRAITIRDQRPSRSSFPLPPNIRYL